MDQRMEKYKSSNLLFGQSTKQQLSRYAFFQKVNDDIDFENTIQMDSTLDRVEEENEDEYEEGANDDYRDDEDQYSEEELNILEVHL